MYRIVQTCIDCLSNAISSKGVRLLLRTESAHLDGCEDDEIVHVHY